MVLSRRKLLAALGAGAGFALAPRAAWAQADGLAGLLTQPLSAETLHALRLRLGTPGMAAGWQVSGYASEVRTDGLRAAGAPAAVTALDPWHIGSLTKGFTAALFARAVEAGMIGWDTPIERVLPKVPAPWRGVTAVELLSHHAGLPRDIPMPDLLALPRVETDARTSRRHYVDVLLATQPLAPPRRKFLYSNAGYVLAGHLLEQVSGQSWEALLQARVLDPLGLASAGFGPPMGEAPRGHDHGRPILSDNPAAMGPAARLHIAVPDLLVWLGQHRDRTAFLSRASWDQLHTPRFGSNYAFGWEVSPRGNLWHNGSNTAWYAEAAVERERGLVMTHCSNDAALLNRARMLLPAIRRAAAVAG